MKRRSRRKAKIRPEEDEGGKPSLDEEVNYMTNEQAISIERLVEGLDPSDPSTIALREAATARPVPAIEKPLGLREPEAQAVPNVLIDNLGGLTNWNDSMRGREWG